MLLNLSYLTPRFFSKESIMQNILALSAELKRLKALLSYQILDTPKEKEFDELVKIAAYIFNTPVAAITFVDEDRQWIKAIVGIDVCETKREDAICNYTIRQPGINEIPDMQRDERFCNFPFVAGTPFYRFYAGIPLVTQNGYSLGAFCIIDHKPRVLTQEERELLSMFGRIAIAQVEISLRRKELEKISIVQQRMRQLINTETVIFPNALAHVDVHEQHTSNPLNIEDLEELNALIKKHIDYTRTMLNKLIQRKQLELQQAVNLVNNDSIKRALLNISHSITV